MKKEDLTSRKEGRLISIIHTKRLKIEGKPTPAYLETDKSTRRIISSGTCSSCLTTPMKRVIRVQLLRALTLVRGGGRGLAIACT